MTLLTAEDARAAGLSSAAVRWRIRSGRWQEVHPRVYCTQTGPLTPEDGCRAALLYAGRGAALSHLTALAWHGLRDASLTPVHVTIPAGRRVRPRPRLVVHRTRVADPDLTAYRRRVRVHRLERAVLESGPRFVAAVVQQGLTSPERLRACLLAMPTLPGRTALDEALADVTGGSRSELERTCLAILRRAGLPEPARNVEVTLPRGRAWLDLCYPAARIAIEVDGRAYHLWSRAWERDLRRQNQLVLAGWTVLRFTAADLRERPAAVAAEVRRALRGI